MVRPVTGIVRVTGSGATLAVQVRGEGPALLIVHGFPFDHAMWSHQLSALDGSRCIALDLRGAGDSDVPSGDYSMGRYAEDLRAVCDALDVASAVCCGFSMGGYVLFEFLRRHRSRVRGLVLCDTRPEADTVEGKQARDENAALVERDGVAALADRVVPKLLGATTRAGRPELVEQVRGMAVRQPAAGVIGALRAMRDRPDSTGLLGGITVPTLVVHGAEDEVVPPPIARAMAARIPGAHYVEVAGAGHLAPLEQPERVTRALQQFLGGW
ncbi:MAG TPA: alpha/beta fold hydrolase [Gemmatimonadales bacterium]|nr:alpha/beta fold hydrolase [Gemmatimonadales bacterium]